jgi:hypothetical protein
MLPQLKKMFCLFSRRFHFVILTVIFLLLQGTFSVVYNMHLYFMRFQTRSHFRDEPINLIISGNDYKYATLSTSIALKKTDLFFKNIHS